MKITKHIKVESRNYTDDFGIKRTAVEIVFVRPSGMTIHIPTLPPVKVRTGSFMDDTVKMVRADYEEAFERFFDTLIKPNV